jgi:hypothetical protein
MPWHWEDLDYKVRRLYQYETTNKSRERSIQGHTYTSHAKHSDHAMLWDVCVASCIITMRIPPLNAHQCGTLNSGLGIGLPKHNVMTLVFHLPCQRLVPPSANGWPRPIHLIILTEIPRRSQPGQCEELTKSNRSRSGRAAIDWCSCVTQKQAMLLLDPA